MNSSESVKAAVRWPRVVTKTETEAKAPEFKATAVAFMSEAKTEAEVTRQREQ